MSITQTLDQHNLVYSQTMIICQWLEDGDCFGDPESTQCLAKVEACLPQLDNLIKPKAGIEVRFIGQLPTGGGQCGNQSEFREYSAHIQLITSNKTLGFAGKMGAEQLGDILFKYFKDPTKGRYALMHTGLKNCTLAGPFNEPTSGYFYQHWFLRYRVLAHYEAA